MIKAVLDNMKWTAAVYRDGNNESHNAYELLMSLHRDIEAAVKALEADRDNWRRQALSEDARANAATSKESLQVGNVARLRESAEATMKFIESAIVNGNISVNAFSVLQNIVSKALSAPARNCDLYKTEPEAYQAYRTAMKKQRKRPMCISSRGSLPKRKETRNDCKRTDKRT